MEASTRTVEDRAAPLPASSEHGGDSPGHLVAGMAQDAKRLGDQYISLAKIELDDWLKVLATTLTKVLVGSGLAVVGTLFTGLALGDAAEDWNVAPRWAVYAALAALVLIAGVTFLLTLRSSSAHSHT